MGGVALVQLQRLQVRGELLVQVGQVEVAVPGLLQIGEHALAAVVHVGRRGDAGRQGRLDHVGRLGVVGDHHLAEGFHLRRLGALLGDLAGRDFVHVGDRRGLHVAVGGRGRDHARHHARRACGGVLNRVHRRAAGRIGEVLARV